MRHIVVVGGGTAGWLTANILAAKCKPRFGEQLKITVVESPHLPIIGVGEGTVPTMRQTLQLIGVDETEFIRQCDVTFKQSIKFVNWRDDPNQIGTHHYHHLFQYPVMQDAGWDFFGSGVKDNDYAAQVSVQFNACEQGCGPKKITHKGYQTHLEYAYHLDASKFATFLAEHGKRQHGIIHTLAHINSVNLSGENDIASLQLDNGSEINADLFVDCSGFNAELIDKALQVPFENKNDVLFVDRAIAVQVPYDETTPIPSSTIATAHPFGWSWDIGLTKRRGVGYVYSSKYQSEQDAEQTLLNYLGSRYSGQPLRKIDMNVGYRKQFWQGNCVAIGLSAGFLEPLEATAILLVEAMAKLVTDVLPTNSDTMQLAADEFNKVSRYGWDRVIDFIKLHYCITARRDTAFWRDNCDAKSIPQSLQAKLASWQTRAPSYADFPSKYEVFHLENYLYVLHGMGFFKHQANFSCTLPDAAIQKIGQQGAMLAETLLPHRALIEQVQQFGFARL